MPGYVKDGQATTKAREYHEDAVFRADVDSYRENSALSFDDSRQMIKKLHSVNEYVLIIHGLTAINMAAADTVDLKVLMHYQFDNLQAKDVTTRATWNTSDGTKATVSQGTVTAVASGTADITATMDGMTSNTVRIVVA